MMREDNAANGWDALRGQGADQAETPGPQIPMPPGFDADEFLRGAKMAYTRLQASWDKRDMNDIAQFTTTAVQDSVREQMAADPKPSTTEILLVNAQLLGVTNEGEEQYAQVFFDVLLRETPAQETPSSAREVWHFVRPVTGGNWKLDGIYCPGSNFVAIAKLFVQARDLIEKGQFSYDQAFLLEEEVRKLHPAERGLDTGFYDYDKDKVK